MAITGGVKFFDTNVALFQNDAEATASTGDAAANRAIDRNPITKWRSVGSGDTITETFTITFDGTKTIDRVAVVDHNFKEFTIKYDVAGVFTDFTTVVGIGGALGGGISETTFSEDTAYYEFDSVSTTRIQLSITKTQTADEEKKMSQVIATAELGTLQGFPVVNGFKSTRNQRTRKVLSGRSVIQKSNETVSFRLDFKNYPPSLAINDFDLMYQLFDREANFSVWLCGGKFGTDNFRYTLRGFRLKDFYEMQVARDFRTSYSKNVYINVLNLRVDLEEAV